VLNDLTGGEPPPFKRLCRNLAYHTHIEEPPEDEADEAESGIKDAAMEAGGKALAKKGGKLGKKAAEIARKKAEEKKKRDPTLKYEDDVEAAFEGLAKFGFVAPPPAPEDGPGPPPPPVPLDAYQEELKRVRDALKAKVDIDGPEEQKALQKTVAAAKSATDALINDTDAKGWAPTLEKWLPPPLKEIGRLAEGDAAGQLSKAWCTEVVEPFESLAKRYPFAKGKKDIEIKTVTEYFGRDKGKVWSFYNTTLSSRIAKKHAGYVIAKTGAATTRSINPAVTRFLDRAQDVTDALFPEGADAPLFEFNLTIEAGTETVDTTALMIDGASVVYRNGPYEAKPLQWPGEDDPGCKVQAKGFGKNGVTEHKGEWGFFRILEEATVDGSQGQESFKIEWDLTSQDAGIVKMRLAPKRDATPLYGTNQRPVEFMGVFRHPDLAPPRQLYVGGFMCAGGEE
jgi:type VI secretion system protein ImpL